MGDIAPLFPQHRRVERITWLAFAFAVGIALGKYQPSPVVWPWLLVSALCLILAALPVQCVLKRAAFPAPWLLAASLLAFGAGWHTIKHEYAAPTDLAALLGEDADIVRVTGIALKGPELHRQVNASLAQFGYRNPSAYFPVRIDGIVRSDGTFILVRGELLVSVGEPVAPFRAGDRVTATGHFVPFDEPRNPGELNRRELAKAMGQAGAIHLPKRELLTVTPAERFALFEWWLGTREHMQRRADAMLLSNMPDAVSEYRDFLLKALLLGVREPDLHGLNESFKRLGIAHFLAISGLHLGILAAMFIGLARFFGGQRAWHAWLLIALIGGYLILIEVRLPVARAGIMTIAACLGLAFARRLNAGGLVALSGMLLLLWRPDQLFWPGFQLSFAVVLGLLHLSPILRQHWFGLHNNEAATLAEMMVEWLKDAFTIAMTAWLVATPIIAFHFGIVSPWGIVLAVAGVPMVALLLALGYAKMILTILMPSAALLLGGLLSLATEIAIAAVNTLDSLPWVALHVPFPSALWTLTALTFITVLIARPQWMAFRARWSATCGFGLLTLWLMVPMLTPAAYALRIDMISVGHGTCIVVRSERETIVFDAGSNTHLDSGNRWIIPAMRRLGVRSIDTIVISHPHFDHYSAVIELVEEFNAKKVYVTHQFIEHAREHPEIAVTYLADVLINQHRLPLRPIVAGETRTLGQAQLTWLHPPEDLTNFQRDNQQSMVIRIDVAGRRVLLTGDVERAGLAWLLANHDDLRADVMEMPHHGAWHDLTGDLLDRVRPEIILQSSGRLQWQRDRWQQRVDEIGAMRYVTRRDGASWVEIGRDGSIRSGSFRRNRTMENRTTETRRNRELNESADHRR